MPSLQEILAETPLPAFFLIKNLEVLGSTIEDAASLSGEFLAHADTLDVLRAHIPFRRILMIRTNKRYLNNILRPSHAKTLKQPLLY
jgi:hypothetical protein